MLIDYVRLNLYCPFCSAMVRGSWETHDLIGGQEVYSPTHAAETLDARIYFSEITVTKTCSNCNNVVALNLGSYLLREIDKQERYTLAHTQETNGRLYPPCNTASCFKKDCD